MDNYTTYGLLAAGAIGLYLASKSGGLGEEVYSTSLRGTKNKDYSKYSDNKKKLMIMMSDILGDNLDIEEEAEGIDNKRLHDKIKIQKENIDSVIEFLMKTYK